MNLTKQEALLKIKELEAYINSSPVYTVTDINYIQDAEKVLLQDSTHTQYLEAHFIRPKDWLRYQLETIIKAVNFIDNGNKVWIPDWLDNSEYKYYPYFEKNKSGWVLHGVGGDCWSCCSVGLGLYFKNSDTGNVIVKRFWHLYEHLLENKN